MKGSDYEQAHARKIKTRLRMIQHAQKISHTVGQNCRIFGITPAPYYFWLQRFEKHGTEGLPDRSRRPSMIRCRISPEVIA